MTRFFSVYLVLLLFTFSSFAQLQTEIKLPSGASVIDQANFKEKGTFVLLGNHEYDNLYRVRLLFVDTSGDLKWSNNLIEKSKHAGVNHMMLVASESSVNSYVVALRYRNFKPSNVLVFEINPQGLVRHFEFEIQLSTVTDFYFACASSKGLHLFVRAPMQKGEGISYLRGSAGFYTAQYFIANGSQEPEFINMDNEFNPTTVLSAQNGDTLFAYLSTTGSIKMIKYLLSKNKVLTENEQTLTASRAMGVRYIRQQNGFYQKRDYYDHWTTSNQNSTYYHQAPMASAYWFVEHNNSTGLSYAFTTLDIGRNVPGRKKKKKEYIDKVLIYTFDSSLNAIRTTEVTFPLEIDEVKGHVNRIDFLERGWYTNVYCHVSPDGNSVDIAVMRGHRSGIAWMRADMKTGEVLSFKNIRKEPIRRNRRDYMENYVNAINLSLNYPSLPDGVRDYVSAGKALEIWNTEYSELLSGYSEDSAVLVEVIEGEVLRVIRFAPGLKTEKKEFKFPKMEYIVDSF